MNSTQIFGLQFALNLIVFALIARWYIAPRLSALPLHAALTALLLLHALRTLAAIVALRARLRLALVLVWLFSIEGTLDLLNAIYQGLQHDLTRYQLGVAWYIPTLIVPALLVTHALIVVLLVTRAHEYDARLSGRLADQHV